MSLAGIIQQTIGLSGTDGAEWHLDQRQHGPYAALLYATETPNGVHLVSSPLTQTEWWQTFLPTNLCPRFGGKLGIDDWCEPFCVKEQCAAACGAEDGFVELRANRFRLAEDAELIYKRFPHLHMFIERAERQVVAKNQENGMGWQLTRQYPLPCLEVMVPQDHLVAHLLGLAAIWSSMTGVTPTADVEHLPPFDIESLDIDSDEGLMAMAQHYALQEIVRRQAEFFFADLIADKGGEVVGNEYKVTNGLRYVIGAYIECFEGDKGGYMGRAEYRGGMHEIRRFAATTLGGGRW